MNATKALELLTPIPANQFMTENYTNEIDKCCSIGHLMRLTSTNPNDYSFDNCKEKGEVKKFVNVASEFGNERFNNMTHLSAVNDGRSTFFEQKLPKNRVTEFLQQMITAGY